MFEFYESAHKLNLSFNKQITIRGWTDVFKAVKNVRITAFVRVTFDFHLNILYVLEQFVANAKFTVHFTFGEVSVRVMSYASRNSAASAWLFAS